MSLPIVTVGALILDPHGRLLLLKTHKWRDKFGLPGGKIHEGETMEAALRREVREETGLALSDVRFALAQDAVFSPEFYKPAHFVLLNFVCQSPGGPVTLNEEAEGHAWVEPEAALAYDLNTPTRVLVEWYLKEHARAGC